MSRTGHDNNLKWNSSKDTAENCVTQALLAQNDKESGFFPLCRFSKRSENVLRFHEFSRTFRNTKTEKLS